MVHVPAAAFLIAPLATEAWTSMGEALLISLILGIQRESDKDEVHAGLRDFLIIGLIGGICGLLQTIWLTLGGLAGVVTMLAIFRAQTPGRTGITTELAGVAAFFLTLLVSAPEIPYSAPLAIGLTIVVAYFLEARRLLVRLARESITEVEFNDTLRFLAVVLVVYPVLPEGHVGPYGFLEPKRIWFFVILVSSVSYVGYFLQKFLGARQGLRLTSVLGGLASTTAATASFSRDAALDPDNAADYLQATVLANAVQFPRIAALLAVVNPALAVHTGPSLIVMTAAGLAAARWLHSRTGRATGPGRVNLGNPFQLASALKFGAIFALVLLIIRIAVQRLAADALYWVSAIAGLVDLDAVMLSLSDLLQDGKVAESIAIWCIFIGLAANAVFKIAIAWWNAGRRFGLALGLSFLLMLSLGGAALWLW